MHNIFDLSRILLDTLSNLSYEQDQSKVGVLFRGIKYYAIEDELQRRVDEILAKMALCRDLVQEQSKTATALISQDRLDTSGLLLQLFEEVRAYIEKEMPEIIGPAQDGVFYGIPVTRFLERYKTKMFIGLDKLLTHFISVFREIYVLVLHDCYLAAFARFRIMIEIYGIFLFFTEHPECIERYSDHYVIRLCKHRGIDALDATEKVTYRELTKKYETEMKTFELNYGWAGDTIKKHNSIQEILEIAFKRGDAYHYVKERYGYLSEYSHCSSYATFGPQDSSKETIEGLLDDCGKIGLYIISAYTKWLLEKSASHEEPVGFLPMILDRLAARLCRH